MTKKVGVAILGLGVVGGGTYKTLVQHHDFYVKTQGVDITVESVLVRTKEKALALGVPKECIAQNIAEVVANPAVDIVIETIGGVGAAKEYVLAALREGKTVVTANKELICKHWHELERVAKRTGCGLYFEASCVGGVPIIRTLLDGVQGNHVQEMMGIINGTTNFNLTKMAQEGAGYEETLKEAQRLGYAEADPTSDVEGYDALYKLSILASLAFHTKVPQNKIYREGIGGIDSRDIAYGKEMGYTLKLLGIGKNTERGLETRVHPTFIKNSHPLASVNDSFNAVYLKGDAVGDVMLYGRGAGEFPTASAVVSDVLYAATHSEVKYSTFKNNATPDGDMKFVSDFASAYYMRLSVDDKAGALAKISGVFGKCGISLIEVSQTQYKSKIRFDDDTDRVPLVIITYKTTENNIHSAVAKLIALGIGSVKALIRVEQ